MWDAGAKHHELPTTQSGLRTTHHLQRSNYRGFRDTVRHKHFADLPDEHEPQRPAAALFVGAHRSQRRGRV